MIFPKIKRVHSSLIANDLIAVKPMSHPLPSKRKATIDRRKRIIKEILDEVAKDSQHDSE
jgi:hypothetical protein